MNDSNILAADVVDPDIRRFVDGLNEGYRRVPDFDALPMSARRQAAEQVRAPWRAGGPSMRRSLDIQVAGRRARLHIPEQARSLGAMLYLHGGGWVMFSIDTHDRLMREYAHRSGVAVLGIDYSLSPEAKFPVALNEAVAAVEWLQRDSGSYGIDPDRLAIGGDSAGANLSIAAALKLRALGTSTLRALLLNYGAFTPELGPGAEQFDGPRYMLTVSEMQYFWRSYAHEAIDLNDPLLAPLSADVHGLPPTHLCVAACDILAEGNRAMAAKLKAASVPTELHIYEGATHSFLEAVSISALADRALETAALWLRRQLAKP